MGSLPSRQMGGALEFREFKGERNFYSLRKIKEDLIQELVFLENLEGW